MVPGGPYGRWAAAAAGGRHLVPHIGRYRPMSAHLQPHGWTSRQRSELGNGRRQQGHWREGDWCGCVKRRRKRECLLCSCASPLRAVPLSLTLLVGCYPRRRLRTLHYDTYTTSSQRQRAQLWLCALQELAPRPPRRSHAEPQLCAVSVLGGPRARAYTSLRARDRSKPLSGC